MMDWILNATALSQSHFLMLLCLTTFAGIVRGFSGFALSAMVMAIGVIILPPIELIPMLWWLEMSASLLMVRKGYGEADRPMSYGLAIGSLIGTPIGLSITIALPEDISKAVALSVIVILAATQLAKVRLTFLATKSGLYGTGLVSGIVNGVANVGGMVVAFYVLAADKPARVMRASLVLFLFLSSATSIVVLMLMGVMDFSGMSRGITFAGPTLLGVFIGQRLFTERLAPYYRPFCLTLLIGLAIVGLIRTQIA